MKDTMSKIEKTLKRIASETDLPTLCKLSKELQNLYVNLGIETYRTLHIADTHNKQIKEVNNNG